MPRILVFDVNETLIDMQALDTHFGRVFGDASVRQQWFSQVLQSAFVATVTGVYHDFSTISGAALDMIAAIRRTTLAEDDREQILGSMQALPPYPEIEESLELLYDAQFHLAALTNSPLETVIGQLTNAGLYKYFDQVLSVDAVRVFKPAAETYRMAARSLGVGTEDIRLIAAHAWDVAGALRAGCAAAFVARPGKVLDPLAEAPDVVGENMLEVAQRIIDVELGPSDPIP